MVTARGVTPDPVVGDSRSTSYPNSSARSVVLWRSTPAAARWSGTRSPIMCRARSVRALASRVHPPFWDRRSSWMAVRRCLVTEPVSSSVVMVFSGHDGHCTGEPQQCGHLHAAVGPGEGELAQLLDYVAGMTHGGATHSAPRTTPTAIHLRVRAPASQEGGTAPPAPTCAPFAPLRRGCPRCSGPASTIMRMPRLPEPVFFGAGWRRAVGGCHRDRALCLRRTVLGVALAQRAGVPPTARAMNR